MIVDLEELCSVPKFKNRRLNFTIKESKYDKRSEYWIQYGLDGCNVVEMNYFYNLLSTKGNILVYEGLQWVIVDAYSINLL